MKTKILLFMCLFLGIGLTQLSAQKLPEIGKSGSWAFTFIWDGFSENVPLNCTTARLTC
jgi:hypothetical protein